MLSSLRLSNETIRIAIVLRLGLSLCEPHVPVLLMHEVFTDFPISAAQVALMDSKIKLIHIICIGQPT